jgi:hypothetical protein
MAHGWVWLQAALLAPAAQLDPTRLPLVSVYSCLKWTMTTFAWSIQELPVLGLPVVMLGADITCAWITFAWSILHFF